jgi:multicomponent Na+:H+ antiporter subunit D
MTLTQALPLLVVGSSLVPGIIIFFLGEKQVTVRIVLNMAGTLLKLALTGIMLLGIFHGVQYEIRLPLLPGIDLFLRAGPLAM